RCCTLALLSMATTPPRPPRPTPFPYTTLFRSRFPPPCRTASPGRRQPACSIDTPAGRPPPQSAGFPAHTGESPQAWRFPPPEERSEEHTSELQSRFDLVCRLLLEIKN